MKALKKINLIFVSLSIVILIACILPVILSEDASISSNSNWAIVFGICSIIFAVIAFANRKKRNLFVSRKFRFLHTFSSLFEYDRPDADSEEYKKEFALCAFIFCASIPFYIPLAFFAKDFYSALSSVLTVTILRHLCTLLLVLIPPIIKNTQDKKKDRMKDEADRKEQERRESMGKWK